MRRLTTTSNFLLAGLLVGACAAPDQAADRDAIRQQYDAYNAAFESNDVDAILDFYVDNATRLPSDGSIITGLAAIRDSMTAFRERNDYVLDEYSPAEIQSSGDLAVTYSTFDEHWTSRETGETTRQVGRWLVVWERWTDGTWKITREMWTVEQPE